MNRKPKAVSAATFAARLKAFARLCRLAGSMANEPLGCHYLMAADRDRKRLVDFYKAALAQKGT